MHILLTLGGLQVGEAQIDQEQVDCSECRENRSEA